jgi:hypothetical protein
MKSQTISAQQFVNKMCKRSGTKIGSLFTRTPLKLKVEWERSGRNPVVVIREGRNSMVGINYAKAVNRQRVREQGEEAEEFIIEPRRWGTRIMREDGTPTPFVRHTKDGVEKLYLTIAVRWQKNAKFEDAVTGKSIDSAEFENFSYARSSSSRQGVENEIVPRDYTLSNIHGWLHNGTYYTVVHNGELPTVEAGAG